MSEADKVCEEKSVADRLLESVKAGFPGAVAVVKARAWVTDEEFGYDRWKADQYSLGRGTHDCIIMVLPDSAKKGVDYKKLLKRCLSFWIEAEGACMDPDLQQGLSVVEKDELKAVIGEIEKDQKDKL